MPRKKEYTEEEIKAGKCFKCGKQAEFQWSACADSNTWRLLCGRCDLEVNVMVVRFLGFKDWRRKIKRYATRIGLTWSDK